MKADPGRIALESLLTAADRLSFVRELDLPRGLLADVGTPIIERLRRRVAQETAWEMRRHAPARRLGLYAIFLMIRQSEITDGLIDLLLETVHKLDVKAERTTLAALTRDVERVYGKDSKERLLADIAAAATSNPDGTVRDVIFPVVGEAKLKAIMAEYKAHGAWDRRVHHATRVLRLPGRALETLADHQPHRKHLRHRAPPHHPIEGLPIQQDRARDGLQTGRDGAEKLAPSRRSQPVAKTRSRCDIRRRD